MIENLWGTRKAQCASPHTDHNITFPVKKGTGFHTDVKRLGDHVTADQITDQILPPDLKAKFCDHGAGMSNLSCPSVPDHFCSFDFPIDIFQSRLPLGPTLATAKQPQFIPSL
jgi:hypothetical protein